MRAAITSAISVHVLMNAWPSASMRSHQRVNGSSSTAAVPWPRRLPKTRRCCLPRRQPRQREGNPVTATPATLLRASRRMAEHFDEIAPRVKGSSRPWPVRLPRAEGRRQPEAGDGLASLGSDPRNARFSLPSEATGATRLDRPDGPAVFQRACRLGLEGIGSKRADRRCRSGRCRSSVKMLNPAHQRRL
jgi:hypothetical protein